MLEEATKKTLAAGEQIAKAMEAATAKAVNALEKIGASSAKYVEVLGKAAEATVAVKGAIEKTGEETSKTKEKVSTLSTKVEDADRKTREWIGGLRSLGSNLEQAGSKLSFFKQESISAFEKFGIQERAEHGLSAALLGNQRIVDKSIDRFKEYASSLQDVTTYGDEVTLGLLKQAVAYGLNEHQAKRAVKEAISLAENNGVAASTVIKATAKLAEGSTEMLGEYIPTLDTIRDKTEKVATAHKLLGDMFGIAKARGSDSLGMVKQLRNAWGDFEETIGKAISEKISPLVKILKDLTSELQSMPEDTKKVITNVLLLTAAIGSLMTIVGGAIVVYTAFALVLGSSAVVLASQIALLGAVAVAYYSVTRAAIGAHDAEQQLNEARKEGMKIDEQRVAQFDRQTARIVNQANNIGSRIGKESFLKEQLISTEKSIEEYKKIMDKLPDTINELWKKSQREVLDDPRNIFKLTETDVQYQEAKNKLVEYQKFLDNTRKRAELLKATLDDLVLGDSSLVKNAVRDLERELEKQRNTLGMTSDEIKVYEIRMLGATEATLSTISSIVSFNKAINEAHNLTTEMNNTLKGLTDKRFNLQLDNRQLTESERNFKRMQEDFNKMKFFVELRANSDEIKLAESRISILKDHLDKLSLNAPTVLKLDKEQAETELRQLNEHINAIGIAIKEVSKSQLNLNIIQAQIGQVKVLERTNQLLDKGAELTKQYRTPIQELKDTVKELKTLSQSGVINEGTFNRALDEASKKFIELDNAARGARQEIMMFDAVEFKSTEAKKRIAEFVNETRKQFDEQRRMMEARKKALDEPIKIDPKNVETERKAMEEARKFIEQQNKAKSSFQEILTPNVAKADYLPVIKAFESLAKTIEREILDILPKRKYDQLDIMPRRVYEQDPEPRRVYGQAPMPRRIEMLDDIFERLLDSLKLRELAPDPRRIYEQAPMPREVTNWRYPDKFSDVPSNALDRYLKEQRRTDIAPMPREVGVKPEVTVSSRADSTLEADSKEMVRLLRNMDGTLSSINKKEAPVITVAKMTT